MPMLERWTDAGQDADDDLDDHLGEQEPTPALTSPGGVPGSLDNAALAELINRIMYQDEAAMAALYDALSGRVYAVALYITGQASAAEEVLQDTFWQVWRQAPRFDAMRGNAVAWIMTMARSRVGCPKTTQNCQFLYPEKRPHFLQKKTTRAPP